MRLFGQNLNKLYICTILTSVFMTKTNFELIERQRDDLMKAYRAIAPTCHSQQEAYEKVMTNENMALFTVTKQGMDDLMNQVNTVLTLTLQGADPMTCPTTQSSGCTGSCATCGGCG